MTQSEKEFLDNIYDYYFNKFDAIKAKNYLNKKLDDMYNKGDISSILVNDYSVIIDIKTDTTISSTTKQVKIIKVMRLLNERNVIEKEQERLMQKQRPTYRSSC